MWTEEEQKWMLEHPNTIQNRPEEELKALAKLVVLGEVFTSQQVRPEDSNLLQVIFLPVMFMEYPSEEIASWSRENWGIIYADMKDASPTAINGYPSGFSRVVILNKNDSIKLMQSIQEVHKVLNTI
jgi:hypothetical protein